MANNSNRKAIEFMVQGALPPHSTNVLWVDTSVPTLPVLKIFENGAWTTVHTGDSKAIELLSQTVLSQQKEITELTEGLGKNLDNVTENLDTLQQTVAKEENATANKNELKQHIIQENRNIAGDCIIPDFELPCLPFEKKDGFSGLYDDGEFYFGDFMPQASSTASQLFVGAIVKVTGENATEDEFAGFPIGSSMSVAAAVSEEEAGYEQGLYSSLQEGDPVYGVTSEITWQKDRYYRVTGFHDIYDMTNHEVVEGCVITYKEVDPATITDLGRQVYDKIDNQVAKQGSDSTATNTAIAALIGYTIQQIDGV